MLTIFTYYVGVFDADFRFFYEGEMKIFEKKWFAWGCFLLYMSLLVYFLFFSERYGRTEPYTTVHYNLKPFLEIQRYVNHMDRFSAELFIVNIIGNIVAFMPFGFLVPQLLPKRMRHVLVTICVTYLFVLTIECVQMFTMVGSFDVDDIILNTVGSVLGFFLARILLRERKAKRK